MTKKRIFIANDASFLSSGYGIYGKEIISRLHNSGKYEVAELGCYADVSNPKIKDIPWKFYPNAVLAADPRYKTYKENSINQFGSWRFNRAILDFKPHIVFDVRDYWMYAYQEVSPFRKYFHWILMPTVDSAPQKNEWLYTFANADIIVPYTEWSKETLSSACGNQINLYPNIANAGINPDEFYPVEDKEQHKIKYFGNNPNIIGLVMRNQKRKLLPDIMLAFKKYLNHLLESNQKDKYNNTFLYLHTSYPEENGWNIPALLLEHNILDKVYFSYICRNCKKFFPSKFQNAISKCKFCHEDSATFCNVSNSVTTEQLNEVYNLFDIFVQYAICEGFGMPQVEAAACGLHVASVDYSAMSEIVRSISGIPIPIDRKFRELETNADRVYPCIDSTVHIIKDFFEKSTDQITQERKNIRNKCLEKYTWDNVYKTWDECFESIDINDKPSWDSKDISSTNHDNMNVPPGLNPKAFVEYICNNIINEPYLFNTSPIQQVIQDISNKITCRGGMVSGFSYPDAVKVLEYHLNNKIVCEQLRKQQHLLQPEDYLNVNN
jgi:glycosyltransferase involved in cell wall biosynthesis